MSDQALALRILQLNKAGFSITFKHRKPTGFEKVDGERVPVNLVDNGEVDDYYVLTCREDGQDYKRTEIPRAEVAAAYVAGELPALLLKLLDKVS